jgi:3-methyladenine DNA glycosylase AlkD
MSLSLLIADLKAASKPEKAEFLPRYFKTGPGEYGEGDVFWGISVPEQRAIAKKYRGQLTLTDIETLLKSPVHEQRLTGLLVLNDMFAKSKQKQDIATFYLDHLDYVNNWDLVDSSARVILGTYLLPQKDRSVLYKLAQSKHLWRERVAMISTGSFINAGDFKDALAIAEILLHHNHDLIHKAVGWMLRDIGDKDRSVLNLFLEKHAHHMPRTALRYCLEHYPPTEKKLWMAAASNLKKG